MMSSHHPDTAHLLQPLSREHVLTEPSLALFQKVLLVTDGSGAKNFAGNPPR